MGIDGSGRLREETKAISKPQSRSRASSFTRAAAFYLATFLIVTAGAIWLALRVTPLQTVSAAGQTA